MEDFQNAFNDADVVFVAPVYPAGEEPIEGVDADALAEGLRARGHRMVKTVDEPGGPGRATCATWRPTATSSSAWAPAILPNGPPGWPTASRKAQERRK